MSGELKPGAMTPLSGLAMARDASCHQVSSYDRSGGNDDFISIGAGQTAIIGDLKGPGTVNRIWLTVTGPDPDVMRKAILKIFWDDEPRPSVEAPVADFFLNPFLSRGPVPALPMGFTSGGYYAYVPMPFSHRALIQIENQSNFPIYSFYYQVTYSACESLPPDTLRFHAQWRRQTAEKDKNLVYLEAEGRGHYVGTSVGIRGRKPFSLWFLEGDELIFVDGASNPSIHGTGTEDYFNAGWYFNTGTFTAPYHGLVTKDPVHSRIAAFRFHVEDPIPFKKSLSVQFEHGGTNDAQGVIYDSMAYWYQAEPHAPFPMLPDAEQRMEIFPPLERGLKNAAGAVLDPAFKFLIWSKGLRPKKINPEDRTLAEEE